jgi:hypothetical protein
VPVIYERPDQEWLVAAIAGQTFVFFKEGLARRSGVGRDAWGAVFLEVWRNKIIYFVPMLKNEAFFGEREWRLICTLSDEELRPASAAEAPVPHFPAYAAWVRRKAADPARHGRAVPKHECLGQACGSTSMPTATQ